MGSMSNDVLMTCFKSKEGSKNLPTGSLPCVMVHSQYETWDCLDGDCGFSLGNILLHHISLRSVTKLLHLPLLLILVTESGLLDLLQVFSTPWFKEIKQQSTNLLYPGGYIWDTFLPYIMNMKFHKWRILTLQLYGLLWLNSRWLPLCDGFSMECSNASNA